MELVKKQTYKRNVNRNKAHSVSLSCGLGNTAMEKPKDLLTDCGTPIWSGVVNGKPTGFGDECISGYDLIKVLRTLRNVLNEITIEYPKQKDREKEI
jgi:hypothetical protein